MGNGGFRLGGRQAVAVVAVLLIAVVLWFVSWRSRTATPVGQGAVRDSAAALMPAPGARLLVGGPDSTACSTPEGTVIRDTMTLEQVARVSGVPVAYLARQLRLPADVSRTEPLRRLRAAHGFTMEDVRRIVADHQRHC